MLVLRELGPVQGIKWRGILSDNSEADMLAQPKSPLSLSLDTASRSLHTQRPRKRVESSNLRKERTIACKFTFSSLKQIFREKILLFANSPWRKWNRHEDFPICRACLGEWVVSRNCLLRITTMFLPPYLFCVHFGGKHLVYLWETGMPTLSLSRFPPEDPNICVKWNEKQTKCQHRSSGKGYFVILKKFYWNSSLAKKRGMISIKMTSCLNYSLPLGSTEHYSFHTW